MDLQYLLEVAAEVCMKAHAGQRDKAGKAYFLHPFRVALACEKDEEKIVALLHDVLEDSDITSEDLLETGFPQEIVDAVVSVTKQAGESYEDYVARAKENHIGRVVKLHDLEDNLDASRLDCIDHEMCQRLNIYLAARHFLMDEAVLELTVAEEEVEDTISSVEPEKRPVMTTVEYFRSRREESNRHIWKLINNKLSNTPGNDNFQVIRHKQPGLHNPNAIDTLIEFIESIGYNEVLSLDIKYRGKYGLVSRRGDGSYKEGNRNGWFVLSNCSNKFKALYINQIAEALNLNVYAELVSK